MAVPTQLNFTREELDNLQQLRATVLAFQKMIANLDANEQSNEYNDQFNKWRFEAKALLQTANFDNAVPRAASSSTLAQRTQKTTTRLSGIVVLGVILALVGLGINSIILEDVLINSLGCLISSGGMLLVIGAFVAMGAAGARRKLTSLGDLYAHCTLLLEQIDQALAAAIPGYTGQPSVEPPPIPSAAALMLESLEQQTAYWQQKLDNLLEQQRLLGPNTPPELTITTGFVRRELTRLSYETDNLHKRSTLPAATTPPVSGPAVPQPAGPHSVTQGMPPVTAAKAGPSTETGAASTPDPAD